MYPGPTSAKERCVIREKYLCYPRKSIENRLHAGLDQSWTTQTSIDGTLKIEVAGCQVSFFHYPNPLLSSHVVFEKLPPMASIVDIGL